MEDEKAYEFAILNENKKISPNDSKVKETIKTRITTQSRGLYATMKDGI